MRHIVIGIVWIIVGHVAKRLQTKFEECFAFIIKSYFSLILQAQLALLQQSCVNATWTKDNIHDLNELTVIITMYQLLCYSCIKLENKLSEIQITLHLIDFCCKNVHNILNTSFLSFVIKIIKIRKFL